MFFVYGAENSAACDKAEFVLYSFGVEYRLFIYGRDYTLRQLERLLPGVKSVPQIYHGAKHIGGLRDLYEYLNTEGAYQDGKNRFERSTKIFTGRSKNKQSEGDVPKD